MSLPIPDWCDRVVRTGDESFVGVNEITGRVEVLVCPDCGVAPMVSDDDELLCPVCE